MKIGIILILLLTCTITYAENIYKSFVVTSEEFNRYKNNYPNLQLGMSPKEVVLLLDAPNIKKNLMTKKGKDIGIEYRYIIRRIHPNLVNEKKDKYINLYFDTNNKLKYAVATNLEGFKTIGSP